MRQFRLGTVPGVKIDDVLVLGQEAELILKYVLQMPSLRRFPLEIGARFINAIGDWTGLIDTLIKNFMTCTPQGLRTRLAY